MKLASLRSTLLGFGAWLAVSGCSEPQAGDGEGPPGPPTTGAPTTPAAGTPTTPVPTPPGATTPAGPVSPAPGPSTSPPSLTQPPPAPSPAPPTPTPPTPTSPAFQPGTLPTSDPFSDPTFRRGLEAWRRPHTKGACANCHAPDGIDLARINYTDSVIIRRALLNEASLDDAQSIVAMVQYLRKRWGITNPIDPVKFRMLQPGGDVLPGDTWKARDQALFDELARVGVALAGEVRLDSVEAGLMARKQLLDLDLRTVRFGVPLNRWTEDAFRGEGNRTANEWIPDVPAIPNDPSAYYALHDAYIKDPTPANLWAFVDKVDSMTGNKGMVTLTTGGDLAAGNLGRLQRRKYQAVQIGQHMLRLGDSRYPDPYLMDDAKLAALGAGLAEYKELLHARLNIFWDIGALTRGMAGRHGEMPAFMHEKLHRQIPGARSLDMRTQWGYETAMTGLAWFWLGILVDPSMQLIAGGNKAEYMYERMRNDGVSQENWAQASNWSYWMHMEWLATLRFVHGIWGGDTRLGPARGSARSGIGPLNGDVTSLRGRMCYSMAVYKGIVTGPGPADPYLDRLRKLASNRLRMVILNLKDAYASGKMPKHDNVSECVTGAEGDLAVVETAESLKTIAPHIADLRRLMAASTAADPPSDRARAVAETYRNPLRFRSFPVSGEAALIADTPRISPWYFVKCAGCHGDRGEGRPMVYPAVPGALSPADFAIAVRQGRTMKGMPAFPDVPEAELAQLYQALKATAP